MRIADATILIVDDEPELLEIFAIWLKRRGAKVLAASNGADALKLLQTEQVHALISDMRMPVMDGVTLVRSIHDLNLAIPTVIFVSGFGDVSPRVLYSLGVEALLSKPLGRNMLMHTIEARLRDREELWLEPMAGLPEKDLTLEFDSLEEALREESFSLGRGGCCLRPPVPMPECTVALHLGFLREGLSLDGQGIVRWYDAKTRYAGVEFVYLEPGSRRWVTDRIDALSPHSFIPFCQEGAST